VESYEKAWGTSKTHDKNFYSPLYACETWGITKTDKQNLARFERKVLQLQIFDPRRNQNTGEYKRRKNEEVISMLEDSDITSTMKSKRID